MKRGLHEKNVEKSTTRKKYNLKNVEPECSTEKMEHEKVLMDIVQHEESAT